MLISRGSFKEIMSKIPDVNVVETPEKPIMGAFQ